MRANSLQRVLSAPPSPFNVRREQAAADIQTGIEREQQVRAPRTWSYRACSGRLVELSGSRAAPLLTLAFALVLDAQQAGEPVAWIQRRNSTFFPPDAASNGIDLASLVVLRVPEVLPSELPGALVRNETNPSGAPLVSHGLTASGVAKLDPIESDFAQPSPTPSEQEARRKIFQSLHAPARAAGRLLRSGAFGLIVLDLETERAIPAALLGKLGQLAQRHDTAVCCLTLKGPDRPSLGSLVSLRGEALRRRTGVDRFECVLRVLKDKRNGPGWTHEEVAHGAPGLS